MSNPYPKPKKKKKRSKSLSKADKNVYEQVMEAQPCCIVCGKTTNLDRHHIRGGKLRQTFVGNIAVLCGPVTDKETCHGKAENNIKHWKPILVNKVNKIHRLDYPIEYVHKEE